jgi:NodT family efflux transporter outer membrane factor (OMF) lipoprotein
VNVIRRIALAGWISLAMAGCARMPAASPEMTLAPAPLASLSRTEAPSVDDPAQRVDNSIAPPRDWWTAFHSAQLDRLEAAGLRANADLAAAQAGLKAARELYLAQHAATLPVVQLGGSAVRSRNAAVYASPLSSNATYYTVYAAQLTAAWTPDLTGGQHAQIALARAQAEGQRCVADAAWLGLTANIAATTVQLASLNSQQHELEAAVAVAREIVAISERQHAAGEMSVSDVAAAQGVLAQTLAALPALQRQQEQARDILSVLTGAQPGTVPPMELHLEQLTLPTELPGALPARLIRRRPDIRAARAGLEAAAAQLGITIAARLPNITLAATGGGASGDLGDILSAPNSLWTLGATASQTLLDAGALRHRQRAAEAALEQAKAQYRSTVLNALQATRDQMLALGDDADALEQARRALDAAERIRQSQDHQHALGQTSRLALLNAQLAAQQARIAMIQVRAARYLDTIGLFQSVGGWADAPLHDMNETAATSSGATDRK